MGLGAVRVHALEPAQLAVRLGQRLVSEPRLLELGAVLLGLVAAAVSSLPAIQHLNLYPNDVTKLLDAKATVAASLETLVT